MKFNPVILDRPLAMNYYFTKADAIKMSPTTTGGPRQ